MAHGTINPAHDTRVVVTTPTGTTGRQVLARLLAAGNVRVRAIARDPARLSPDIRERIEVVQGSHADPDVVDRAFADVDALLWVCPPDPRATSVTGAYLDFTRPACDAIRAHGVRRVVSVSALGRGTPVAARAGYVTVSLAMDDMLAASGAACCALTLPSFMDNISRQARAIRDRGMFALPIDGDRRLPAVATRDIASVAATLLLDRAWTGTAEVPVLGPEDLSFNDMAGIMSDVLGREVRYEQISFEAYKAGFVARGMSEAMAQGMADMARAKDEGLDNAVRRTPANSTPTTFRQWCDEELRPLILG